MIVTVRSEPRLTEPRRAEIALLVRSALAPFVPRVARARVRLLRSAGRAGQVRAEVVVPLGPAGVVRAAARGPSLPAALAAAVARCAAAVHRRLTAERLELLDFLVVAACARPPRRDAA